MSGKRLYPQTSNRSCSRDTAFRYRSGRDEVKGTWFDKDVTTADLEREYHVTGTRVQGSVEIRQIFGFNDLNPRTYFAQGGTTYASSKFIREIFNELANSFSEVGFVSRFSIEDLDVSDGDDVFIYDFTSFTSNFTVLVEFLDQLSHFCEGTFVEIVDTHRGILQIDLGELIREYNDTCNKKAEFLIHRFREDDFSPLYHENAGFLGVYGNIVSSTVLHGLIATQIDGDFSKAKCVGDDAMIRRVSHPGSVPISTLIERLAIFGVISAEKSTSWVSKPLDEDDSNATWPYCKRPLFRHGSRMILEPGVFLPIFGRLLEFRDNARIMEGEDSEDPIKLLVTQTRSAFRQFRSLLDFQGVRFSDYTLLISYLGTLYSYHGVPLEGCLPTDTFISKRRRISGLLVPCIDYIAIDEDEWVPLRSRYSGRLLCRVMKTVYDKEESSWRDFLRDGTSEDTMDRKYQLLKTLGYVSSEKVYLSQSMTCDEYVQYIVDILSGRRICLYSFSQLLPLPSWTYQL